MARETCADEQHKQTELDYEQVSEQLDLLRNKLHQAKNRELCRGEDGFCRRPGAPLVENHSADGEDDQCCDEPPLSACRSKGTARDFDDDHEANECGNIGEDEEGFAGGDGRHAANEHVARQHAQCHEDH